MKRIINLNGKWRFTPDLEQRPDNNHNLTGGDIPVYAVPQLDRKDWEWVSVPGVWERYAEKYSIYEGVCWYCRAFWVERITEQTKAVLRFKGVAYRADVFINGQKAGWHESAYTEFTIDVTGLLKEGENFMAVMVDNRALITKWPNDRGYFAYGGIHRDVLLELLDENWLEELEITPVYDTASGNECSGILEIQGKVKGCPEIPVEITMGEDTRTVAIEADNNGCFKVVLTYSHVELWNPEHPYLYPLTISYDGWVYAEHRIGYRAFEIQDGALFLNGKSCRLNGACYVYDSPVYGLVMAKDQLETDLSEMKAANVTAIRTHYPMDDKFYDMCDEMGFLVWIEPNVYCYKPSLDKVNTAFARKDFVEVAYQMTEEMITVARRHSSVVIYGIGNECNVEHPEAIPFFRELAGLVRAKDNTRLLGYAALYGLVGEIGNVIDIIGINSYYGWYDKISDFYKYKPFEKKEGAVKVETVELTAFHKMIEEVIPKLPPKLPILLTEFGADSVPGYHSSSKDLWSEEYHAEVVKAMIRASRGHNRIYGTFVFAFVDYVDPCKPLNGYWKEQNLKGMLSYQRDRKQPFYALQEVYSEKERME